MARVPIAITTPASRVRSPIVPERIPSPAFWGWRQSTSRPPLTPEVLTMAQSSAQSGHGAEKRRSSPGGAADMPTAGRRERGG